MITISQNYLFSLKSLSFSSSLFFFVSHPVVTFGKFLGQQIQEFLGIQLTQWVTPHELMHATLPTPHPKTKKKH